MDVRKLTQKPFLLRISAVLVFIVILIFLLPSTGAADLDRIQTLYDRGQFEACDSQLTKTLQRKPDWHEARELHIQVQLAMDKLVPALDNILFFRRSGQESRFEWRVLDRLLSDKESLPGARGLLEESLAQAPDTWARVILARVEIAAARPDLALAQLAELYKLGARNLDLEAQTIRLIAPGQPEVLNQFSGDSALTGWLSEIQLHIAIQSEDFALAREIYVEKRPPAGHIARQFWELALTQGLVPALELALEVDNKDWVSNILDLVETTDVSEEYPKLLELMPDEPRLLVMQAFDMDNRQEALALLLELEGQGFVPKNPGQYGYQKYNLLLRPQGYYDKKYLNHVPINYVFDDALLWRKANPKHALALADWLAANGGSNIQASVTMLKEIINSKANPQLVWSGEGHLLNSLSLSPDGRWLIIGGSGCKFVNLATGKEFELPVNPTNWNWSPNGKQVAALDTFRDQVLIFSPGDAGVPEPKIITLALGPGSNVLGWLDNSTVAVKVPAYTQSWHVLRIDVTGQKNIEIIEDIQGWPLLNHDNAITWIRFIDLINGTRVEIQQGTTTRSAIIDNQALSMPMEWLPGNRTLLLESADGSLIFLDTDADKWTDAGMQAYNYQPGNWLDADTIWRPYYFPGQYAAVVSANLNTGSRQYSGIVRFTEGGQLDYIATRGNLIALAHQRQVVVYRIP